MPAASLAKNPLAKMQIVLFVMNGTAERDGGD
jgi:hypothetical protein